MHAYHRKRPVRGRFLVFYFCGQSDFALLFTSYNLYTREKIPYNMESGGETIAGYRHIIPRAVRIGIPIGASDLVFFPANACVYDNGFLGPLRP